LSEKKEMHLVKKVSKELGITYKKLGEAIGYSEGALRKSVSRDEISPQLKKAIELYLENIYLKECGDRIKKIKMTLKEAFEKTNQEIETLDTFLNKKINK
jgi:hypothetical protein